MGASIKIVMTLLSRETSLLLGISALLSISVGLWVAGQRGHRLHSESEIEFVEPLAKRAGVHRHGDYASHGVARERLDQRIRVVSDASHQRDVVARVRSQRRA